MIDSNNLSKEQYFKCFNTFINNIKKNEKIEIEELEKIFTDIKLYNNLNFQEIITYMLYCFEIIELTNKWKLKKLIDYSYFLTNMEEIYNAIFCNVTATFKNRVVAATSFESIIEKTINYNVENQIETLLKNCLKCFEEKHFYTKNVDLILLRGNVYCAIYNILKDNRKINEICQKYFISINELFDYERYLSGANIYYNNLLKHEDISYLEITNYLLYKTYNNYDIDAKSLKIIIKTIYQRYSYEYFDKKVFILILKCLIKSLNNSLNIEIVFDNKECLDNVFYINYNTINCSFCSNLEIIKTIFNFVRQKKYQLYNDEIDYINLLRIKDKLVKNKNSIYNYSNMVYYISLLDLNKYLDQADSQDIDEYFDNLIADKNNADEYVLSHDEVFQKEYDQEQIIQLEQSYPIIKLEYDEKGLYKDVATIIQEKYKFIENVENIGSKFSRKQINIYDNLIKYRNCDFNSLLNDYYSLLLMDTIDSNLIKEKEYVLKEVLPRLVEQQIKFSRQITDEKLDEIYNDYINPCIKKISQNRVNNKQFESTKEFLNFEKSNSDNYAGICRLQEILKITS